MGKQLAADALALEVGIDIKGLDFAATVEYRF
ncbi:hypothetical protein J2797_001381 [Paraburkholderia terricola]|nr:hypothetical protein [Paraburkholderia terricola]